MIGVAWMLSRECAKTGIRGGILADEMGLGKTMQMLACISQNLPDPKEVKRGRGPKSTLIVCTKSTLRQWVREIEGSYQKDRAPTCFECTSSQLAKARIYGPHDIVITTYNVLQRSFPDEDAMEEIEEMRVAKNPDWKHSFHQVCGDLFKTPWRRVVLDEGHTIKNRISVTAIACSYLPGQIRWLVTGTPVQNSPNEVYSLLRFLAPENKPCMDYQKFMQSLGITKKSEQDAQNVERLRALYRDLVISRRGADMFLGKAIIDIPKPFPTETITVELSPSEERLLRDMRRQSKSIHRDRMALSHWAMVCEELPKPELETDVLNEDKSKSQDSVPEDPAKSIQSFCRHCRYVLVSPVIGEPCGHAFCEKCATSLRKCKPKTPTGSAVPGFECPSCHSWVTKTSRCRDQALCYQDGANCIERARELQKLDRSKEVGASSQRRGAARGRGKEKINGKKTQKARKKATKGKTDKARAKTRDLAAYRLLKAKSKDRRVPGDDNNCFQPAMTTENSFGLKFFNRYDNAPWNAVPHSAKTEKTLGIILEWQKEAPEEKILVFAVNLFPMVVLGQHLFHHGIKFLYFTGELKPEARDRQIDDFFREKDIKVMIISLKAGGEGLNLTVASRAIIHDLWWHKCAESQAFGRIHRIGQSRRVRTVKVTVNDDADLRCLELQQEKEEDIAEMQKGGYGATLSSKQTRKLMKRSAKKDENDEDEDETDEDEDENESSEDECSDDDEEGEYEGSESSSSDEDTLVPEGDSDDEYRPR